MKRPVIALIVFLFVTVMGISLTNMLFGGNEALFGAGALCTGVSIGIGIICGILVVMLKEKRE